MEDSVKQVLSLTLKFGLASDAMQLQAYYQFTTVICLSRSKK